MDYQTVTVVEDDILLVELAQQGPTGAQGPQGLSGGSVTTYVSTAPVSGHTAVVLDSTGQCIPADAATATHYAVAGITVGAAIAGDPATVVTKGILEHSGWTFTAGLPVYLGLAGALTQTLPGSALFSKTLGIAVTSTRVSLDFQPAIFRS
jgi:hypothetical protein